MSLGSELEHRDSCPMSRIDEYDVRPEDGGVAHVRRCLDCGVQATEWTVPRPAGTPGTVAYAFAQNWQPIVISTAGINGVRIY